MQMFYLKAKFSHFCHRKLVRTSHFSMRLHALSKRRHQADEANIYIYKQVYSLNSLKQTPLNLYQKKYNVSEIH